jgi:DNA-directed RNA polymerase specialized sigma24 family protein
LAELYDRHATAVHRSRFASRAIRRRPEDAVQEVYAGPRQVQRPTRREGPGCGWGHTLAQPRDRRPPRQARARPADLVDDRAAVALPDAGPAPEEQAISSEHGHRIRQALSGLPDVQRQRSSWRFTRD